MSLRRVAIIGGNRIPFSRANGPYATASNQDMLTAALEGLIEREVLAAGIPCEGKNLTGIQGDLVEVEADLSQQTPGFTIIGLADKAIGEATQRVHNACANSGLPLPLSVQPLNCCAWSGWPGSWRLIAIDPTPPRLMGLRLRGSS